MSMNNPFLNDPMAIAYEAFKNLCPDKDCICQWQPDMPKDENGNEIYGITTFEDDGKVYVEVSSELKVFDATEVFAHELAHVAVGKEAEHGKDWQDAFDAIYNEYTRIIDREISEHDAVEFAKEFMSDEVHETAKMFRRMKEDGE